MREDPESPGVRVAEENVALTGRLAREGWLTTMTTAETRADDSSSSDARECVRASSGVGAVDGRRRTVAHHGVERASLGLSRIEDDASRGRA